MDKFMRLVATAVMLSEKRPSTTYYKDEDAGECSYYEGECSDGSIGCIFGQADIIAQTGMIYDESGCPVYEQSIGIGAVMKDHGCKDDMLLDFAEEIQYSQDIADCWDTAVSDACNNYPIMGERVDLAVCQLKIEGILDKKNLTRPQS